MKFCPGVNRIFFAVKLFQDIAGFQVVVPETISLALFFKFLDISRQGIDVKDTPAAWKVALVIRRNLYLID